MPESQVPQFSIQVGLEDITLDEGGGNSGRKKVRVNFTPEEDIVLFQSWLNVLKDPIIGVDQKANSFWSRVKEGYNEYRQHLAAREVAQIKSRWHKLSNAVQKFDGCYKHAAGRYVSGRSEMDIMAEAQAMYFQDVNYSFKFERVWRLLKEPKWTTDQSIDSSSNPATPTSFEQESPSESNRPMRQKAAKRKGKEKVAETSSNIIDLTGIKASLKDKNAAMIKIAETKESENIWKLYEILLKNTSMMSERQHQDHEGCCVVIRRKLGIN